jgi:hypothetical protein
MKFDVQTVKNAFAKRAMPEHVIDPQLDIAYLSPDERDALWFQARDWRELTWDDWQRHYNGIFFFTSDALAYYLPSIIQHSMGKNDDAFLEEDSLVLVLGKKTLAIEGCQHRSCECMDLSADEHDVVVRWMRYLRSTSESKTGWMKEQIGKALAVWAEGTASG